MQTARDRRRLFLTATTFFAAVPTPLAALRFAASNFSQSAFEQQQAERRRAASASDSSSSSSTNQNNHNHHTSKAPTSSFQKPTTAHQALGLSDAEARTRNYTTSCIHTAYRTQVKKWHPDVNDGDDRMFREVRRAYEMLKHNPNTVTQLGGSDPGSVEDPLKHRQQQQQQYNGAEKPPSSFYDHPLYRNNAQARQEYDNAYRQHMHNRAYSRSWVDSDGKVHTHTQNPSVIDEMKEYANAWAKGDYRYQSTASRHREAKREAERDFQREWGGTQYAQHRAQNVGSDPGTEPSNPYGEMTTYQSMVMGFKLARMFILFYLMYTIYRRCTDHLKYHNEARDRGYDDKYWDEARCKAEAKKSNPALVSMDDQVNTQDKYWQQSAQTKSAMSRKFEKDAKPECVAMRYKGQPFTAEGLEAARNADIKKRQEAAAARRAAKKAKEEREFEAAANAGVGTSSSSSAVMPQIRVVDGTSSSTTTSTSSSSSSTAKNQQESKKKAVVVVPFSSASGADEIDCDMEDCV